jgi:predicted ATP-grasp superfamily ATP-dependent carboligase
MFESTCVVKPVDGAGSWLTFAIRQGDAAAWERVAGEYSATGVLDRAIVQPFVAGQAVSVGCFCDESRIELLPVARQQLTDGDFQYQGGTIPADIPRSAADSIHELVRTACRAIPGLYGYLGVDLLLPERNPQSPLVVEINPRLTTSYVGYQRLCLDNLAQRLLPGAASGTLPELRWKPGRISFRADGQPGPVPGIGVVRIRDNM